MTAAAGKTTVKLLLVEDNPLVLELVFRGIEHVCDVMVAHDGGDALLKTVDDPPDVILCDYKMPGLDGRQLFDKLRSREKTRHIPVFICSTKDQETDRIWGLRQGARDYLTKPLNERALLERIEALGQEKPLAA